MCPVSAQTKVPFMSGKHFFTTKWLRFLDFFLDLWRNFNRKPKLRMINFWMEIACTNTAKLRISRENICMILQILYKFRGKSDSKSTAKWKVTLPKSKNIFWKVVDDGRKKTTTTIKIAKLNLNIWRFILRFCTNTTKLWISRKTFYDFLQVWRQIGL